MTVVTGSGNFAVFGEEAVFAGRSLNEVSGIIYSTFVAIILVVDVTAVLVEKDYVVSGENSVLLEALEFIILQLMF